MTPNSIAVLRVDKTEETKRYRDAVHDVISDIQINHGVTLIDISEAIDLSLGTVSNAFNRKDSLSPAFLLRLANCFGPTTLDPFMALGGGRVVPLEPAEDDPLPYLCALIHTISKSRAGGKVPTHTERLAMVPDLKAAQAAITNMLLQAERIISQ